MNDRCELAVIVPIYKVDKYLTDCLNSLLSQTFIGSYSIILVNDASPDRSHEICNKFTNDYPDIITYIMHESNQGSAIARNTGLNAMNANYFAFVDPDDLVPKNALATLHEAITSSKADIVKGNNTILKKSIDVQANYNAKSMMLFQNEECLTKLLEHKHVRGHPWGKIFRSSTLGKIRFTPGYSMAEDLLYCAEAFSYCKKLLVITDNVYRYRLHNIGATGRKYESGAYHWWFKAISDIDRLTRSDRQRSAHYSLKIRTLLQAVKEIEKLDKASRSMPLKELEAQRNRWGISLKEVLRMKGGRIESAVRYIKFLKASRKVQKDNRKQLR